MPSEAVGRRKRQTNDDKIDANFQIATDTKSTETGEPELDAEAIKELLNAETQKIEESTDLKLGTEAVTAKAEPAVVIIGMFNTPMWFMYRQYYDIAIYLTT